MTTNDPTPPHDLDGRGSARPLARLRAEQAVRESVARLGVMAASRPDHLSEEDGALRVALRAHARALGDDVPRGEDGEEPRRLIEAAAYAGGWQVLPNPHIAWVGSAPKYSRAEFEALGNGDPQLRRSLGVLHNLFRQAPLLGSLIETSGGDLAMQAELAGVEVAMERLAEREDADADRHEGAIVARGMADAATLLSRKWVLQTTNVPYPSTIGALRVSPHLFQRPGEIRTMTWDELDLDAGRWTIPAVKMKMRRPHEVPLSRQVSQIIRSMAEVSRGSEFVFPAYHNPKIPISENAINQALRRMGYGGTMTAHGFRSTASSLLNESNMWNPDAIERALAHQDGNAIRAVYNRSAYWRDRVDMMQWWSDHLDALKAAS